MRSLQGLRVLVTGASSGIGELASMMMALGGSRVVGSGRSFSHDAARLVLVGVVERDLAAPGAPQEIVAAAVEHLGGLDVVVSNAGAGWSGAYESMAGSDLDGVLDLNLRAPMHLAQAAAPHLASSGGQLVLVGSIAGELGVAREVAYSTAKAGLRGFADGLRAEWAPRVAVTLVVPGVIDTPFFEHRNRPYERRWPKPLPARKAAEAVVRAVQQRPAVVFVPHWVGLVARLRGGLPGTYRYFAHLSGEA
jgi:NAD(P)-dependent dehydrogenase (short-subunit alcohol dehydrogenase family)